MESIIALVMSSIALAGVGLCLYLLNKAAGVAFEALSIARKARKEGLETLELCKEVCEAHIRTEENKAERKPLKEGVYDTSNPPEGMPAELKKVLNELDKQGIAVKFEEWPKNEDGKCMCPDCTAEREAFKEVKASQENLH